MLLLRGSARRECRLLSNATSSELPGPREANSSTSDAFQKREKANEDWAIRQREKEKLLALKAKLAEQQAHLKQLSDHMYVLASNRPV